MTHGDARLENLIRAGDKLVWIDFREGMFEGDQLLSRMNDLRTCLNSLVRHHRKNVSLTTILDEDTMKKYEAALPADSPVEAFDALVHNVWSTLNSN